MYAIGVKLVKRPSLTLIDHMGHEGSHAICAEMEKMCFQTKCKDDFKRGYYALNTTALISWATQTNFPVALVRLLQVSEAEKLRKKIKLSIVILFRMNLFDWAFSNYWKFNPEVASRHNMSFWKDPQFVESMSSDKVPITKYDPELLLRTAELLYRRTKKNKVEVFKQLKSRGFNVMWMAYENFVKEGSAELMETLGALDVKFPPHAHCKDIQTKVYWIHPKETKYYIANYEECMEKFNEGAFRSFEELLND